MKLATLQVLVFTAALVCVSGYPRFQEEIPNGDYIPHPCKPNFVWKGVGHLKQSGGGERNQFGKDFHSAGKKWTTALCQMDSDGNGITNGVELGDPDCTWTPGTVPKHTAGTSHPGICDPWGSSQCKEPNNWVSCDEDVFNCPAIHEEGVLTRELQYPLTPVPDKETTYVCMSFDLPQDGDYHMIATTPLINESRVMHHIVLLGCDDDAEVITEPRECSMGLRGCGLKSLGLWTLGLPGECFYKEAGYRIGLKGMKKAVLQFHWTNPEKRKDLIDASGLKIYYTKNLRNHDGGTFSTGQQYLEIPPLSPKIVQHSTCSARCTRKVINGSIFLTTGLNHMHYLGVSQYVKLKRVDGTEMMLTDEKHYSYDTPVLHEYDPPIELKPGDVMETVCTYRSLSRQKTAFFGPGTFDEMCYGIFNFYPEQAAPGFICITSNDFELCDFEFDKCEFVQLANFSNPDTRSLVDSVMDVCTYKGVCQHGCRAVVDNIMNTHNCFKDGVADAITFNMLGGIDGIETLRFVAAMKSCDCMTENPIEYNEAPAQIEVDEPKNTSNMKIHISIALLFTGMIMSLF